MIPRDVNGKPKLKGVELLDHICTFRNTEHAKNTPPGEIVRVELSNGMDVELNRDNLECIQPAEAELRRGAILRDTFGNRAVRKCAKRKLNNLGAVIGQSSVVNSPGNMETMRRNLQFASAMAQIHHLDAAEKAKKLEENDRSLEENAPEAAKKLEKSGRDIAKLTTKETKAILYKVFNVKMSGSKLRKQDYTKALQKELEKSIGRYEEFVALQGLESNCVNDS